MLKTTRLWGIEPNAVWHALPSTERGQYQTCELHAQDRNDPTAPQGSATVFKTELKGEAVKWIITDLAFSSWGTQAHLSFQKGKIKTENIFHLIEFALSFERVFSQLKILVHREELIETHTSSNFNHKLSNYKMQL